MKKIGFLMVLSFLLVVVGCSKKIDITNNSLDVESCDKYFELMDCILENDNDEKYTEEMKDELREYIVAVQEERKDVDKESLDEICSAELVRFGSMSDSLDEIGCSIN